MHALLARFLIEKQINKIEELKKVTRHNFIFVDWQQKTESLLRNIFGENSWELAEYKKIRFQPIHGLYVDSTQNKTIYLQGLEEAKILLEHAKNKDIDVCRNAAGPDAGNFKKTGEQSFFAFDYLDNNFLIFETIVSKDDLEECIKQAPLEKQMKTKALIDEFFLLLQNRNRNKERLKEVTKKLADDLGGVKSAMPLLVVFSLLADFIGLI